MKPIHSPFLVVVVEKSVFFRHNARLSLILDSEMRKIDRGDFQRIRPRDIFTNYNGKLHWRMHNAAIRIRTNTSVILMFALICHLNDIAIEILVIAYVFYLGIVMNINDIGNAMHVWYVPRELTRRRYVSLLTDYPSVTNSGPGQNLLVPLIIRNLLLI